MRVYKRLIISFFMKIVNIWELGSKINVKIKPEFLQKLNKNIRNKCGKISIAHQIVNTKLPLPFSTFKSRLKKSYKNFIDLELIIELCELFEIPLEEMQKQIISYKTRRGHNYITNPKLPVQITPLFDMLIAHHMCDGHAIKTGNNRKHSFGYRQYDKTNRELYLRKVEKIFGNINYRVKLSKRKDITKIYFPTVCSELVYSLYNLEIDSFRSELARVPKEILAKNWEYKLAFLIGVVIDEGSIDSTLIIIGMKNAKFVQDLGLICKDLQYKHTIKVKNNGFAYLYILAVGLSKFYKDYIVLSSKYPEVNLGYKEARVKEFIQRLSKPKYYLPGNKKIILNMMKMEYLTANEIASKLFMTRQGARYFIKKLVKEDAIEPKGKMKFANIKYGIKVNS